MINTIGIIGVCYVFFWNILAIIGAIVMRKKQKQAWSIPIVVAFATLVPFLLGLFGND